MLVTSSPGDIAPAIERQLTRGWFLISLRGVVAVAFALVFLFQSFDGLTGYVAIAAAYILCDSAVCAAVALRRAAPGGRLWLFGADALISVVAATAIIALPGLTPRLLVMIVALRAVVSGLVLLVTAIRLSGHTGQLWMVLAGLVSIGFAIVCFVVPFAVAAQIARSLIVYLVVRGSLLLALGWALRSNKAASV